MARAAGGEAPAPAPLTAVASSSAAGLIDQLRTAGVTLTYDPDTQTIRGGDSDPVTVTTVRAR